jgi:hypothetical protein
MRFEKPEMQLWTAARQIKAMEQTQIQEQGAVTVSWSEKDY